MYAGVDKQGNTVYADDYNGQECFCLYCGKKLKPKVNRTYEEAAQSNR